MARMVTRSNADLQGPMVFLLMLMVRYLLVIVKTIEFECYENKLLKVMMVIIKVYFNAICGTI